MVMRVETIDGVQRFTLRQSSINEFLLCPERARRLWQGEVTDFDTAESAIGTSVHTAIQQYSAGVPPDEALEVGREQFRHLSEAPGFRWVKIKTVDTALRHIDTCFDTWLTRIQPLVGEPWAVEQEFNLPFDADGDLPLNGCQAEIWLAGTIDYIDEHGVWDWKTCSDLRKYTSDGWQLKRWGVQPTVYTWAAQQLGYFEAPVPFTFGAMQRTGGVALLPVERGPDDWAWLRNLCWSIATMMAEGPHYWPLNDQHALCSARWCPAWSQCKGHFTHSASAQVTAVAA